VIQTPGRNSDSHSGEGWRRMALGELYSATGGPTASLRQVWQSAAEAVRMAPTDQRTHVAHSGASAAIGLFTGPSADTSALNEYRTLTGETLTKEVRALLALSRGDSAAARRALAEPDSAQAKIMYASYRRPLAAQAYFLLGDYQATLRQLQDFEPEALYTGGFDSRWGMVGRVRLLRAAAFEQLGRRAEARQEYQQVLSQWRMADASLQPFVRQAQQGLARLGDAG
jgi:tetratricopeptide (TPR) repeat protein